MRALILPLLMLAAPAAAVQQAGPDSAGPAFRDCLSLAQVQSTNVVDDQTIDFRLRDGSTWRNRLPYSCPTLGFERAFSYSTSIPQLCHVDMIRVIVQSNPSMQGASCGLGKFERLPDTPKKPKG